LEFGDFLWGFEMGRNEFSTSFSNPQPHESGLSGPIPEGYAGKVIST